MTKQELVDYMRRLAAQRPVFHSEADFQHSLAILLATQGGYEVRLEKPFLHLPPPIGPHKVEVDIIAWKASSPSNRVVIELKYPTKAQSIIHAREHFEIKNNWQTDLSRFDYLDDFRVIGCLKRQQHCCCGYAVILTNADSAWTVNTERGSNVNRDFSIHDGRTLVVNAALDWFAPPGRPPKAKSFGKHRITPFAPLVVPAGETIVWHDFSEPVGENDRLSRFRFAIIGV